MISKKVLSMHSRLMLSLCLTLTCLLATQSAFSKPSYAREFKQVYSYLPSCLACHTEGGGTPLNQYGKDFKEHGSNLGSFKKIAGFDSDADGASNESESSAKSNPGSASSTPDKIGNWLDLDSLIPKEVQETFPSATAWKPLDALLTNKDLEKAKQLGFTLSKEDENTLYIPVSDRRPIGAAIIFPVIYSNKTFFLLMHTDRQLNFAGISALKTESAPALDDQLNALWSGKPIQTLQEINNTPLHKAISDALRKAGILMYIRLKGA